MKYEVDIDIEDFLDKIGEEKIKRYFIENKYEITEEELENYSKPKYLGTESFDVDIDEDDFLDYMWEDDIKDYALTNKIVTADDFSLESMYDGDENVMIKDIIYEIKQKHHCYTKEDFKKYINEWIDFNMI